MPPRPFPVEKAQVPLSFLALEAVIEKRRLLAKRVHQVASSLTLKRPQAALLQDHGSSQILSRSAAATGDCP